MANWQVTYRHRMWKIVIERYIVSYHIISYHIITYHIISYHIISYHVYKYIMYLMYIYIHNIHIFYTCTILFYILYVLHIEDMPPTNGFSQPWLYNFYSNKSVSQMENPQLSPLSCFNTFQTCLGSFVGIEGLTAPRNSISHQYDQLPEVRWLWMGLELHFFSDTPLILLYLFSTNSSFCG